MTTQRKVILEEIKGGRVHSTADEIFQRVRKKLPKISLGTVYRNLDILVDQGVVRKLGSPSHQMVFEGNIVPHYHLRCVHCQSLADVPVDDLPDLKNSLSGKTDFVIHGQDIEFFGLCALCQNSGPKKSEIR